MTENQPPEQPWQQPGQPQDPDHGQAPPPPPGYGQAPPPPPGYGQAPPPGQQMYGAPGPVGMCRGTGISIVLALITCGIYVIVYYYKTHEELKLNTGQGIGGALAAVLAFFIGVASPFLLSNEVGNARKARGLEEKVSAVTGVWILLPLVGGIVWFVKTNGALNEYWISQGAQPA